MQCDECGDSIFIGDEYFHNSKTDENFHLNCLQGQTSDTIKNILEKRYRED